MPNWCSTTYICEGNSLEIDALYHVMSKQVGTELSEFIRILGGDVKKISSRGNWDEGSLERLSPKALRFTLETAWSEFPDFRHFLESVFSSIKIYHISEEPGMNLFWTNDIEGRYFPYLYIIETEEDYKPFRNLSDAKKFLEMCIGRQLDPGESPRDAIEKYEESTGNWIAFREYEIQED